MVKRKKDLEPTRQSKRPKSAPKRLEVSIKTEKINIWKNSEKARLFEAVKLSSSTDVLDYDFLTRMVQTKSKEQVIQHIHHIKSSKWMKDKSEAYDKSLKKSKSQSPIELWMELIDNLVSHEEKDHSKLLTKALRLIVDAELFEEDGGPDYRLIYTYMIHCMTGQEPPILPPLESAVLVDLMSTLINILKDFDTETQRKVLQWKYELLTYPPDASNPHDKNVKQKMAIDNDFTELLNKINEEKSKNQTKIPTVEEADRHQASPRRNYTPFSHEIPRNPVIPQNHKKPAVDRYKSSQPNVALTYNAISTTEIKGPVKQENENVVVVSLDTNQQNIENVDESTTAKGALQREQTREDSTTVKGALQRETIHVAETEEVPTSISWHKPRKTEVLGKLREKLCARIKARSSANKQPSTEGKRPQVMKSSSAASEGDKGNTTVGECSQNSDQGFVVHAVTSEGNVPITCIPIGMETSNQHVEITKPKLFSLNPLNVPVNLLKLKRKATKPGSESHVQRT